MSHVVNILGRCSSMWVAVSCNGFRVGQTILAVPPLYSFNTTA